MKQIKFGDLENKTTHGGILMDDGNVICGCCGGVYEADEMGTTWEIIKVYKTWIDLTEEIIGDE